MQKTLDDNLAALAGSPLADTAACVGSLAAAAIELHRLIQNGGAEGGAEATGIGNSGGDLQKALDVAADRLFVEAARRSPVSFYGSEEQDEAVPMAPAGTLALAIDPLDGSSNIETNVSIGTIFSILPAGGEHAGADTVFRQPGRRQLAAGFFVYGPQLLLVLSFGQGTATYAFRPATGRFEVLIEAMAIPETAKEFAVNASNQRHWEAPMRRYIDDCLAGKDGPRGRDFNMRWVASAVADAYRIFLRGGVYLYPGDTRKGYSSGRIRLTYEANPIAFLAENAGGAASDGLNPILDIVPEGLHQRTPVVFGSRDEVLEVARYAADPDNLGERFSAFERPLAPL
ncbi:class 1 fructose-bisphosphatase [Aureimonas populi]|uniref:Fructose-1,6-bisphosphatase class 1 n=1 Tax=Aureimonas populi TaxID=1701758 RepID=A0ABW5CIK0_9HYPH|nr:class 1 fructose-bisphosphatase [Aureimonas populi]